jgi:quercetin dioxygenase-like cupin family protein
MSSINRPLAGPMLSFDLPALIAEMRQEESYTRTGRAGRTLAKSGRMRVTLVVMRRDNVIGTHQADSPMTLHVLEGGIRFRTGTGDRQLDAGQLLFFGPGDADDIRALQETVLLLTLSAEGDDFLMDRPDESEAPRM